MKNIDKIRAMSAEDLAKNVLMQNTCELCMNYNEKKPRFCRGKDSNDCIKGFVEWLNQDIKIMPAFHCGDIIHTTSNQYVAIDDVWAVCTMRREKICICDIENVITYIFRFDSNGNYHEIWRADDGKD